VRRREFIAGASAAAAASPLAARAQPRPPPIIGYLGSTTRSVGEQWLTAFLQRLRDLGWIERQTVAIEVRWAEGRPERFAEIATEFVSLNVEVIVTHNTPPVLAAKKATSVIPIVFATAGDPVGTGLVKSLARPGGNVTGVSSQTADLAGKTLELVRELLPELRRLAILANGSSSFSRLQVNEAMVAARKLGLSVLTFDVQRTEEMYSVFRALKPREDAVYVILDPLMVTNRILINQLAVGTQVATMHVVREMVEAGGLMSYGPHWLDQFQRAADLVDKILRGRKPADLPVEQPTKFELVINLNTAKALRIDVPPTLLARADEVIE
jgi:putative ABC transport system substrate-binding protein